MLVIIYLTLEVHSCFSSEDLRSGDDKIVYEFFFCNNSDGIQELIEKIHKLVMDRPTIVFLLYVPYHSIQAN